MNKKMKRFFVLKNFREFFLSDVFTEDTDKFQQSDVVTEAEIIINEYFEKMGYADIVNKKKKGNHLLLYIGLVTILAIAIYAAVKFI